MDKIQSIYDLYLSRGIISKDVSLEMFSNVDSEKLNKLHQVGLDAGIISNDVDVDMFSSAWGVKKKEDLESPSEGGSSDFVQISDEDLSITTDLAFQNAGIPKIIGGFLVPAVTRGLVAGSAADETFNVMSSGKEISDETLDEYIKVNKLSEAMGESDAMKEFNKKYDEDVKSGDSGIWAFLKGVADNPKVAAEVAATSMAQMAAAGFSSGETMGIMAAGAGIGAGTGAALGATGGVFAPATATIGAIGGTIKGAMAAAGGITEVSASFTEFLKDELGDQEFTQENIRKVLADEDAKQRIINKSLARGATVAAIDFLAAGASGKAVSGITKVGRTGKVLRGVAGTSIEAAGGATGETAARVVTGQELDTKEIMFEAIGEAPGAVVSGPIGMLSAPKYNINNSRISKKDFLKIVETSTDQELLDMNITIENDEAMSDIYNKKVEKASVKKDIDPSITDEKDIETVAELELKIKDLRKRKTTSAKNRIKEYSDKIKEVQSKYDNVDSETTTEETTTVEDNKVEAPKTKVSQLINRPVVLNMLGGAPLNVPIEGDLYIEGQQLVVEDTEGNITELGTAESFNETTLEEAGIQEQVSSVNPTKDGNLSFEGEVLVPETAQIKRNKKGNINRVILRNDDGSVTRTLRGANAEEAAYQVLLKEATTPEQEQFINEQLENDAEFQNEFTETTEPTQAETTEIPQQDTTTEGAAGPAKTVDFNTVKNKALKALSTVVPGVKVVLHSTPESYSKAVGDQNSRGAFLPNDNTIHVNTATANEQTIAHETFHALMLNKLKSDNEVSKRTEKLINAVSKTAPAEIKAYLDAFASNYDANMQSEEKIAELVGVLSSGFPQLDAPSKLSVKNFIQYIATKLGLKEFTDREAIDFLNTISNKIGTGETITTEDVAILERKATLGGKMSKRFQANFKDETSGLEFVYDKNSEAFQALVDNGFVTKDKSIIDFANNFIFLHQPDAAFSGEIIKDGETIVEGKGGMYYPIKFHDKGYFWASTANAANKMASDLNKVYAQNNGKIFMALTSAPSDKLLSSTTMSNAVLDFFTSKAIDRKFKLKKNDFNKALVKAANTTVVKKTKTGEKLVGLGLKTRVSSDMNETISLIKEKLGADNSSFGDRKTFAEALIGNVAEIIKNDPKSTEQFADLFSVGIQNKYFKGISKTGKKSISKANITQAISEMFTEPILKDNIDREKGGQVYAILELDSKVEPIDATEHESYPKAIKAVDGNVKLHILKDRFKWNELFEDPQTNDIVSKDREKKIYPTSGVSTQGLKLNVSNINEKLQKSGVDFDAIKTIKSGLKLGISDTTILETLKEQGYDPNNADELLNNYKEEYRKEQSKKEGLFDDTNNVLLQQLDKAYRNSLSPRGFLPKSMMIAKEVLQGMIDSEVKNARRNIELLDRKLKRYSKENLRVVVDNIDAYIRGNNQVELDADIKEIASEMRNHIDNLSQKLIESGAVDSQESIDNIKNNMGSYLNRSYKLFDKKNYRKSVPESVMNAAKLKLKEIYREQAEEESQQTGVDVNTILNRRVNSVIENILSKNEADAFVASSKTGSKNLKSLSRKKDIPAEIRALMGEYGDPSFNYIQSVNKIQSIVSNQMFLDKMRVKGEGVFFFKEPTGSANVLVAAKGSEEYNPLNGYYTTQEIKDALDNKNRLQVKLGKYGDPVLNFYMGMLGFVKKSKTVFSIGTQMKNVIGIVPVLIANGYVTDFQSFRTALQALDNDLRNKNNADLNTKMNEYLESGIINSNIVVSEIRSMMKKGETFEDAMIKRLSDDTNPVKDFAVKGYQAIDKALTKAYQTTDDFSKILGYEVEKKRYAKAKFKTEFDNLTEAQKQEVRDVAAEIIKNNIPNYNRVGGAVKALKVIPVAGTFISFHAEAIRTAFNTVNLAVEEMKNPETAEIGKQRLGGILAVSATATLLPLMFGLSSIGGSEDEEEESQAMKYARMFMPDWDKNSSVVISQQPKDGKFSYVSLSASDPYGALSQAVNAFMAGENLAESSGNAIWELISPFFEEDLVVSSLGDMWTDLVNIGKGVDTFGEGISNFSSNAWKMVQPGTFTSAVRVKNAYIDKEKSTAKEIVGQVTGFKPRQIDIAQQAFFIAKEANALAYESKKEYNKAKRKLIKGEPGVTLQDVKNQYDIANKKQQKLYGELIKMYKGATYLGASHTKILDQMKAAGVSKDIMRGIVYGIIPDMNK